ncbi:MAG TPA: class I SAM-dependent methyltransferase [Planctomycetota bacterium]|nr:class I SAM-dependent methyltransferase [Planctomycetota bacterium]
MDAYAGFLVVQALHEGVLEQATDLEDALEATLEPRGIVRKLRWKQTERGRVAGVSTRGERPPPSLTVIENGIPFEVELLEGLHTGLFTDMREEHARMRRLARNRRVLNTFAYTGAFSLAAVLGGAESVTSVDIVARVLERARRNFRLSGLDPAAHHFARMEVLDFLQMARKKGWTYSAIVLDPPTFSTFKSGSWSLKTGYPVLLRLALGVLDKEGLLWVAANTESAPQERIERHILNALEDAGREGRLLATGGLPPDYPTLLGAPASRYLKVYVLVVL